MTKKPWIVIIVVLAIVVGIFAYISSRPPGNDSEIVIGAVLPLTGDASQWGIPPRNGAQLAVDEINAAGGIAGKKLRLVVEDTACDPRQGVSAFNKLRAAEKLFVVIGGVCSGVTLAVAPIAEQEKIALISPASTNPNITDAGDFIFRVIPSDALRGRVFAEYLYQDVGIRRVAFLYINNESGVGNRDAFKVRFSELGGDTVAEETYAQQATDVRTQLTKIKASDAEAVVVVSFPNDTILVMKQAKELDLGKPLYFQSEAVEDATVLREAGAAAEGAVYILAAAAEGDAATKFANAYEERFGKKPELYAAEGYDVVYLIAEALRAKPDSPLSGHLIRDYFYQVKNRAGASGTLTFDKNGDVMKPMAIKVVKNGQPVQIKDK